MKQIIIIFYVPDSVSESSLMRLLCDSMTAYTDKWASQNKSTSDAKNLSGRPPVIKSACELAAHLQATGNMRLKLLRGLRKCGT